MPDINEVKLKRLIAHLEDEGANTPQAVASILKAKPENTKFLRGYVEKAAESLEQPELVTEFDTACNNEPAQATEKKVTKPKPPAEGEIVSEPEPEPEPESEDAPEKPEVAEAQHAFGDDFQFRYRTETGESKELRILHTKGNVILLEDKAKADLVKVLLHGEEVEVNLTELATKPAGDAVEIAGGSYPVATLLVIAQAAKG